MPAAPMAMPPPPPMPPPHPARAATVLPPPLLPLLPTVQDLPPAPELEAEPAPKSSRLQVILALALVLCVAIAAGINFWEKKSHAAKAAQQALGSKKIISPETLAANNTTKPAPVPAAPGNSPPSAVPKIAGTATTTAAAPVGVPAPAPVKFPPLRLQSIFYRPSNPSVLINGKTLFLSDEIQGVTVADISPSSVTLVLSGQTNVLTLR